MGYRRDEVDGLTIRLRQQVSSAAAGSKELVAVNAGLESHKANFDSLNEVLKVIRKAIATLKGVVEKQRARLETIRARMAESKNCGDK